MVHIKIKEFLKIILLASLSGFALEATALSNLSGTCPENENMQKVPIATNRDTKMARITYSVNDIKVSAYSGEGAGGKNCDHCVCVTYTGALLAGCGGECTQIAQGYRVILDRTGAVVGSLPLPLDAKRPSYQLLDVGELSYPEYRLKRHAEDKPTKHEDLSDEEWFRLLDYANDPDVLKSVYRNMKDPNASSTYATRISHSNEQFHAYFHDAGNSVATFLVHLSRVRESMNFEPSADGAWPIYDGPMPTESLSPPSATGSRPVTIDELRKAIK